MRLWLFVLLLACVSCASTWVKIVDIEGRPVEGAVVVSEKGPYILQRWKYAAVVTNRAGVAKVVDGEGYVFHEDYHPIIDGSELDSGLYWSAPAKFKQKTTIYRIKAPGTSPVQMSDHTVVQEGDQHVYEVPIASCNDARVTYNIETSELIASSHRKNLIASKRFYFERGDRAKRVGQVSGTNNVAFYCESQNGLSKIGVAARWKGATRGVWKHNLVILEAHALTTETYLEPRIKCLDESKLTGIRGTASGLYPKMYVSDNLEQRIAALRRGVKCFDSSADRLFVYIVEQASHAPESAPSH